MVWVISFLFILVLLWIRILNCEGVIILIFVFMVSMGLLLLIILILLWFYVFWLSFFSCNCVCLVWFFSLEKVSVIFNVVVVMVVSIFKLWGERWLNVLGFKLLSVNIFSNCLLKWRGKFIYECIGRLFLLLSSSLLKGLGSG